MPESRPKLLVVGGPGVSAAAVAEALGRMFQVVTTPPDADLGAAIGGVELVLAGVEQLHFRADPTPASKPAGEGWASYLLNAIGEGVCLSRASGEVLWANDFFRMLDEQSRERIAAIATEHAEFLAEQRRFGEPFEGAPARRSETTSADGSRFFEVQVSPVLARFPGDTKTTGPIGDYVAVVVRDVSGAKRARQRIDAIEQAGAELMKFEADLVRRANMIERLQMLEGKIIKSARELLNFDHFGIRLLDEKTEKLELVIKSNLPIEYDSFDIYPRTEGNGISGWVAATGRSYICRDTSNDELFLPGLGGARSSLTVALKLHDKVVGIMNVESQNPAAFDEDDRLLAEIFARYIAMAIHTLDLLVIERSTTNKTVSGRVAGELAEPLQDICTEVDILLQMAPHNDEVARHIAKIRTDVENIRKRVRDVGQGPTTLLGVEKALEDKRIDPALKGRTILVADDEPKIRRIIGDVLRNRGCNVHLCENGAEAIAALEASTRGELTSFDLVVSDIKMPDRNGYEVFAAARRARAGIPVILMTGFGYDPNHSIVRASQEGLQSVLFKPFQIEQLVEIVKKAIP
jgi:CheY-like chemotaxis protein/GAF domain-containing protein